MAETTLADIDAKIAACEKSIQGLDRVSRPGLSYEKRFDFWQKRLQWLLTIRRRMTGDDVVALDMSRQFGVQPYSDSDFVNPDFARGL